MPGHEFFRQAGFFVIPEFIDEESAASLRREMTIAPREKAFVVKEGGIDYLDEAVRKVESSELRREIWAPLKARLRGLIDRLQEHFDVQIEDCETPTYLVYGPGDFFKPHSDGGPRGQSEFTRRRRVSVVIFLNRQSAEPEDGTYGEGRLTFHGLLDGPQWEHLQLPLTPEPGLLIAFPSEKIHEVTPVSHGLRFTVATWFYAPDPVEQASQGRAPAEFSTVTAQ